MRMRDFFFLVCFLSSFLCLLLLVSSRSAVIRSSAFLTRSLRSRKDMEIMDVEDTDEISTGGSNDDSHSDQDMEVEHNERNSESDNEADKEDEDDIDISSVVSKSKKRSKRRSLDADGNPTLTPKQINKLNESESLYQSNLYRFQMNELLAEIRVKSKVRVKILEWFNGFKNLVKNLNPSKSYPLSLYKKLIDDVEIPLSEDILSKFSPNNKSSFRWIPPEAITSVGSWALETSIAKLSAFDVAIEMPSELFHKTDVRNHTYHLKRVVYIAYLARKIRNCGDKVKFTCPDGDPLKPVLQVYVKNKKLLNVQIHFILPRDFTKFVKSGLGPLKNNLRASYFLGTSHKEDETGSRTSCYNQSLLHDVLFLSNQAFISSQLANSPNVCEAIKLLKVWLEQRSLNRGFGSFSNFIMTMYVTYLLHKNKINGMMNSYQIIRIVFVNLMQSNWCKNGISFETVSETVLNDWHSSYEVVFLDNSGQLNFTSNMSRFTFNRIIHEAKQAIDSLNSATTTAFQSMFISKAHFFINFDHVLQLEVTDKLRDQFKCDEKLSSLFLNHSGVTFPIAVSVIAPLLERCLGNRATLIDFELQRESEWDLTEKKIENALIRFGIIVNRDVAFKLVEKCESEDGAVGASFKEFWGERSQLRRFMDGRMLESVSFEDEEDKSRVLFHMINYILQKHLDLTLETFGENYLDGQLERLLEPELSMMKIIETTTPPPSKSKSGGGPDKKKARYSNPRHRSKRERRQSESGTPVLLDEVTNLASKSFDGLSKTLRQLEGLPLDITSVQGTSAILRFSNIYPTPPQRFTVSALLTEAMGSYLKIKEPDTGTLSKVPKHVEPIGVVIQLESSGKWPDDIKAIERLKAAFLIRIGQLLQEQFGLSVQFFPRYLHVLKDGFIFRIRLTYYRELTLLKQIRGENGLLRIRDNPESFALERKSLILPQITSTLHSLHRQFGAFGRTCRLAKRWIASQLLLASQPEESASIRHPDTRFTEESIELLVASLFLQHSPFLSPPNEAQVGFLRFLNLLGNTDWKSTSFILNFNSKLEKVDCEKIESEFVRRREILPLLFIATPEDKFGSVWTKHLAQSILLRAGVLAKFAFDTLLVDLSNGDDEDDRSLKWKKLFKPSTKVFDGIIWMKKEMLARKSQGVDSFNFKLNFNEYTKPTDEEMPIVDFDPVRTYYQELREAFGHLCTFVNDIYGGTFIAFAWKPEALRSRAFEISQVLGRKLGTDGKTLVLDVDSILEEMEFIGEGIVNHIELKATTT